MYNEDFNKEQQVEEINQTPQPLVPTGPMKVSKVFSIIGAIVGPIYTIASAGMTEEVIAILLAIAFSIVSIVFTAVFCTKLKNEQPISTGFRVCMIFFISPISGSLALSDKKWPRK